MTLCFRRLALILLVAALTTSLATPARGCICVDTTPLSLHSVWRSVAGSEIVFLATVQNQIERIVSRGDSRFIKDLKLLLGIIPNDDVVERPFLVSVDEVFKGTVPPIIEIFDAPECGPMVPREPGAQFIAYARARSATQAILIPCSHSYRVDPGDSELALLREVHTYRP